MSHGSPKKTIHLRLETLLGIPAGIASFFFVAVWLLGTLALVVGVGIGLAISFYKQYRPMTGEALWKEYTLITDLIMTSTLVEYLFVASVVALMVMFGTMALLSVVKHVEETYYRFKYRLRN